MAYHYLNVIDDYSDNINILKEKFSIHPKNENRSFLTIELFRFLNYYLMAKSLP